MKYLEIKHAIEVCGFRQSDIAKEFEVSTTAVSLVVKKAGKSRRIQNRICEIIGKSFDEVWTED